MSENQTETLPGTLQDATADPLEHDHEDDEDLERDHLEDDDPEGDDGDDGDEPLEGRRRAKLSTEQEIERNAERLFKEAVRHGNRVAEIMGSDFDGLVRCELCWDHAPGFRWNVAPQEPQLSAVRVAIGLRAMDNFHPSATEAVCSNCGGLGEVKTGSLVPKYETLPCDPCEGKGFIVTRPRQHEAPDPAPGAVGTGGAFEAPEDGVQRDMFGTPITDPDYGKMPALRERPIEYWQDHKF